MAEDDKNATNPPPVPPTPQAPHTLSTIKLPILKKGVSTEDVNQKFLRSLPSFWSQVSLIMRTKPGVDTLSFDDLYNNLRVFESDVKCSTASSSSTQNVAFISSDSTNSTNEVSTAYIVSTSSGLGLYLLSGLNGPQLDHEDLEQVDEFDLEEMDLKWQVAMISTRLKKFYKKTGRKLHFDAKDEPKAMVTIDGDGVDWTGHAKDDTENYALMAFNSNNSGSATEVTFCSKECEKTYAKLKKLYDEQREQLDQKEIKKAEEEMQKTLDTKQETMGGDLQNRMNLKLWSLLMEMELIGLVMLKMTQRTML
uniref:Uncharacterized protein n=1 Tax=Tanacetum cinerariifolium TaxID=118510 RepID=A0A6L2JF97_TANCI|nr:hypothetical protein [Tanacetum cinerariifolium]